MENKFKISIYSKVFCYIICVVYMAANYFFITLFNDDFINAVKIILLRLVIFFLVSCICSWFIGFVFGQRKMLANIAYISIWLIMVLGLTIKEHATISFQEIHTGNLQAIHTDTSIIRDEEIHQILENIETFSKGESKQIVEIISATLDQLTVINKRLEDGIAAIKDPRILDYSLLQHDVEFAYQEKIVDEFVTSGKLGRIYYQDMAPNLIKNLMMLDQNLVSVKILIKEANSLQDEIKTILPAFSAQIQVGYAITEILILLKNNQNSWSVTSNGQIMFDDQITLDLYNSLRDRVKSYENINFNKL